MVGVAVLALVLTSCSKGTYQVEIFPEMHYQQSVRYQEPPRLAPHPDAVPITGKETPLDPQAASAAQNPLPASQEVLLQGAEKFRVNCAMCHGAQAQGDGPVGGFLVSYNYLRPPNLTANSTQSQSDGQLFTTITNGVVVMPEFKNLLNEGDRWAIVQYLRYLAQR